MNTRRSRNPSSRKLLWAIAKAAAAAAAASLASELVKFAVRLLTQ